MSEECNKCSEHIIDCKCIEHKANAYFHLGSMDRHIINMLHWIDLFEDIREEVASTDMDKELEDDINKIKNRLMTEIGMRMTLLFP